MPRTKQSDIWNKPFTPKKPVDSANPTHYVNNQDFYDALVVYKRQAAEAIAAEQPVPVIPRYIGECFIKIANGLANKYNFRNYSYIDDMISAGIETCVKNCLSFDPEKSKYAFAYFTRAIWNSFIEVIGREHRQADYKRQLFLDIGLESFELQDHDDNPEFAQNFSEYIKGLGLDKVQIKSKKEKPKEPGALDNFFEGDPA